MRIGSFDRQPRLELTREHMLARHDPEHLLDTALNALHAAGPEREAMLDEPPVPIYTTDGDGLVTYWNRACVEFAGREPKLGRDRWCVTWQLYTTTGEPLRHEDCPMAQAIRQQRPVRDAIAIAERPDGSRAAFKPYPTPLFDEAGNLTGAVNMLIDVTDEQSEALHEQAERCRRLAGATYDRETSKVLGDMAEGFDKTADDLTHKRC
jgi:PAS domain S-box-containing protein